jgi:hypothetical protein
MTYSTDQNLTFLTEWIVAISSKNITLPSLKEKLTGQLAARVYNLINDTASYKKYSKYLIEALGSNDLSVAKTMLAAFPPEPLPDLLKFREFLEKKIKRLK